MLCVGIAITQSDCMASLVSVIHNTGDFFWHVVASCRCMSHSALVVTYIMTADRHHIS